MKKKTKRLRQSDEYHSVLSFLVKNPNTALNYKQIGAQLDINPSDIPQILDLLVKDSKIKQVDRGKFMYVKTRDEITGVLDFNQRGIAYLMVENLDEDIKIKPGDTLDAFDGDTVHVKVAYSKGKRKAKAFVTEVVQRARTTFVGTVSKSGRHYFIIPDHNKIHTDFYVPEKKAKNANHGDKVLVRFTDWPADAKNPFAEVVEVFGPAGENTAEMHAIVAEFGFDTHFEDAVEQAAQKLPKTISQEEIAKRKDFRNTLTFTIDPEDAKDFDDALSFKRLEDGWLEIGVHIADVSHYVQTRDKIDEEALDRGTSVYLVDRTIPMLPEVLSNELCSLRPHEDSLCYAVIFKINENAEIREYEIVKTVIHSDHRYSYEQAQEGIINGKGEHAEELALMNKIAKRLRKARFNAGAINFETTEFRFKLDDKGKPLSVVPKQRFDAHKMIEEYMLLANRTVAKHVSTKAKNLAIPYRVHEEPSFEKLQEFVETAANFGYKIDTSSNHKLAHSINSMVQDLEGKLEADILQPLAIRSMEKAYYTTKKTSHFGLAFPFYTHFTSPIRRYPDLITHRYLHEYLTTGKTPNQEAIERMCKHSSEQEQKAVNAERASIKYKQIEYLQSYIGNEFEGIISGVTEWGIYVEIIENKCEGMVRIKDIPGDNYDFYPKSKKVIGQRTKNEYGMGQRVQIRIKNTNIDRRTVDFEFAE
ncbi:ribonuclease R [bacterium]|nr:ribonuclease R [bacterium]